MRTLVVVRALKTGGMERVAINLADAFADQGHESHLLFYKKRDDALYPDNASVHLHQLDVTNISASHPLSLPCILTAKLSNLVWRKSFFLIAGWVGGKRLQHKVTELEQTYGEFDRIIFRGEGTYELAWSFHHEKAIYVLENLSHGPANSGPGLNHIRFSVLFKNKHLACVSNGVMAHITAQLRKHDVPIKSLQVITNPCPIKQIQSLANATRPDDIPRVPYILNVARLVPQKGQDLLLEAYAQSKQQLPLVIVGSGKLEHALKQQAESLNISEKVIFAGNQENPYVWMKHAQLFVLSSKTEGLGIVLFEALACDTPIISVDCAGGVRDVFSGELEQYLCERTPTALALKIDQLIDQQGYAIRPEWIAPFKPENVVERFLKPL